MAQDWSREETLRSLIANGQEENLELEFKRSTAVNEEAKTELSKDVSAFANTIGGTIIYGIVEHPDPPHKAVSINPIDPAAISKEWLEQVINSRIQPRIIGFRIIPIDLPATAPGQVAYAVEIPESSTAHQAYDNKYYRRFNFQSLPMADHEVRQAMNRVSKTAYRVWFDPYISMQNGNGTSAIFRATVVNVSEITPNVISAILYLPQNAFGLEGHQYEFTSIGGMNFRRFEGRITNQWNPGRPSQVTFNDRMILLPTNVPAVHVHLKLFDNFGLGLHEAYEITLPGLNHTVLLSESDRKPSSEYP